MKTRSDGLLAISGCLVCQTPEVMEFLDLGITPLANKFLSADELDEAESAYPLRVGFCPECSHVQLMDRVPPAAMFEDYLYVSSASSTLSAHLEDLAATLVKRHGLGGDDLVIDIGSNDGALLRAFAHEGVRTLGVDPAVNLAERGSEGGIDRFTGFFGAETAREIRERWGPAALLTATNTFPHIPDLDDFLRGIDHVMAPGGAFVLEAHYLADLLAQRAFDTVYHEHVSYWALRPMTRLFDRHGMAVVHAERLPIHHGQLRATVQRVGDGVVDQSVHDLLADETAQRLDDHETYVRFAGDVQRMRDGVVGAVRELRRGGQRVAAYGAPAKGMTLLSFFGLGPEDIDFIADVSPLKQGRFTPGSHIPIASPERLLADQPDAVLLLAWNFEDEILAQQSEYRKRGGRFIIPVPEVRVV